MPSRSAVSAKRSTPAVEALPQWQQARREQIVLASLRLLDEHHFDDIPIQAVADEAGVALGTLYRYFRSKEQVFAAALVMWARQLDTSAFVPPPSGTDPAGRMRSMLDGAVRTFERKPQLFTLIAVLQASDDPEVIRSYGEFVAATREMYLAALTRIDPAVAQTIERLLSSTLSALMREWIHGLLSMGEVRRELDSAVDVIFSKPRIVRR